MLNTEPKNKLMRAGCQSLGGLTTVTTATTLLLLLVGEWECLYPMPTEGKKRAGCQGLIRAPFCHTAVIGGTVYRNVDTT